MLKTQLKLASTIIISAALLTGCSVKELMMDRVFQSSADYFNTPSSTGSKLSALGKGAWTFNHQFDRGLIVETATSIIVVDSFNNHYAAALKSALTEQGITKPVSTLIIPTTMSTIPWAARNWVPRKCIVT